jgi:hypothetical protein
MIFLTCFFPVAGSRKVREQPEYKGCGFARHQISIARLSPVEVGKTEPIVLPLVRCRKINPSSMTNDLLNEQTNGRSGRDSINRKKQSNDSQQRYISQIEQDSESTFTNMKTWGVNTHKHWTTFPACQARAGGIKIAFPQGQSVRFAGPEKGANLQSVFWREQ